MVKKNVVLDTSFLMKCAEWRIDVFSELDRVCDFSYAATYVPGVLDELKTLEAKGGKTKQYVKIVHLFLKKATVLKTVKKGLVDDVIVEYAKNHVNSVVATHDSELKKRVKVLGRPVVYIRQKKYLVFQVA